ncbi:MAG: PEP/pyruvate-binding domain-containing protein [Thermodesulfobacteriota bacterium]|nr:PEP/pyruvate-binding domain-containing protein [Thermodesulfobacteriota bacterium]
MAGTIDWIKTILFPGKSIILSPEELQSSFKARYGNFRALLTANNNALEAMAEMEQALQSGQTFSMAFIRSRSTAVMINVYKMIHHLREMSEGRYQRLETAFEKISAQVDAILEEVPRVQSGEWIIPLTRINRKMADQVGEKMANLGEAASLAGIETPQGFAITVSAAVHFLSANKLESEILRLQQMLDPDNLADVYKTSAAIQQLISKSRLPPDLEEKIYSAYAELEKETQQGVTVAMRSSALGEDIAGVSFAGQYHTELNVHSEFLGRVYKGVVASKYSSRAILYRMKRGYRHKDIEMCVGCLAMVDAEVSGVIYTRDPANPASLWVTLNVIRGTAQKVVDGTTLTDLFHVSRQHPHRILKHKIAENRKSSGSTLSSVDLLTMEQAKHLTKIALILEDHFGSPQDIEWSIDKQGKIIILQSRPMVPAHGEGGADGGEDTDNKRDEPESSEEPLLRGVATGSPGVACGPVFLVRSSVDMLQFPKGAVLVVAHPLPEWAPLLTKATALIGETGSVAGHLATVSREFGIPALFGVGDALKKLANGEVITVDAGKRIIHSGRREDLLAHAALQPDLMAGSPVQALLHDLLQHIAPLNLTDPGSPYFKSNYCETLHDITRFCHEKSVVEMFSFGEKNKFDPHTAMRLVADVPLDWWVIDLADGFREGTDITNKTIRMEDIVSTPMIAIWEGISAFSWQGPPAVSAKGLGSILFQSTMQPGFDPAVASAMTVKNYFLISRNFCNLSVRLGYHFAMIEAYLSKLRTESYVSFTFKGGAADDKRKIGRIALLSEILAQFDFRIEQKGDSLTARVEKQPIEFLRQRLKILGYLSLHARQIDMVMNNQASVDKYRKKFLAEIKTILSQSKTIL